MKTLFFKLIALLIVFIFNNTLFGATSESIDVASRHLESYVDTGSEASIEITLSATPGNLTTVTFPNSAKGFRIYPRSNHIRFDVNGSASAVSTDSDGTVGSSDFASGGIAKPDIWETRLLPSGSGRTVTLRSTTASVVVDMEIF